MVVIDKYLIWLYLYIKVSIWAKDLVTELTSSQVQKKKKSLKNDDSSSGNYL